MRREWGIRVSVPDNDYPRGWLKGLLHAKELAAALHDEEAIVSV